MGRLCGHQPAPREEGAGQFFSVAFALWGFGVKGAGFGVKGKGAGFEVKGAGFGVKGAGFGVKERGCGVGV